MGQTHSSTHRSITQQDITTLQNATITLNYIPQSHKTIHHSTGIVSIETHPTVRIAHPYFTICFTPINSSVWSEYEVDGVELTAPITNLIGRAQSPNYTIDPYRIHCLCLTINSKTYTFKTTQPPFITSCGTNTGTTQLNYTDSPTSSSLVYRCLPTNIPTYRSAHYPLRFPSP
jgi:hypothetical protein